MEQKYNTCLSMPITKLMSKLVSTASLWVKGVITRGDSDLQNKKKEKKDWEDNHHAHVNATSIPAEIDHLIKTEKWHSTQQSLSL